MSASPKTPTKKSSKKSPVAAKPSASSYTAQIVSAIRALKSRTGVSRQALVKYITENTDHAIQKGVINRAIKKGVESGLISIKAGHSNTYVLGAGAKTASKAASPKAKASPKTKTAAKKAKPAKGKKAAVAKASPKKAASPKAKKAASPKAKKSTTKKTVAKKSTDKKSPAKKKTSTKKKTTTKKAASKKAKASPKSE